MGCPELNPFCLCNTDRDNNSETPHWISDLVDDLAKAADIISSENPTEAAYEQSEEETMKALVDHEIGNEDDIEWYRGCYFESNHWVRRGD